MSFFIAFTRAIATGIILLGLFSALAHAADANKTLRLSFTTAETSYDNAFASDEISQSVGERIIESMLGYHYLARPVQLVPRTLEGLPVVSDNGATYLCKIRPGIFYADDPRICQIVRPVQGLSQRLVVRKALLD